MNAPNTIPAEVAKQFDRLPPHNTDAEAAFLGAILLASVDMPAQRRLISLVSSDDFYQPDNAVIHRAIAEMSDAGKPVDPMLLHAWMKEHGRLQDVGGAAYLVQVIGSEFTHHNAPHYAKIILRHSRQRHAIAQANALLAAMYGGGFDDEDNTVSAAIQRSIDRLWEINRTGQSAGVYALRDVVSDVLSAKQECANAGDLSTGLPTIDYYSGVFSLGCTTIVAARPSMGKSTMIRWLLSLFASQGVRCGLIAVEEQRDKVARNYLSAYSSVENQRVRSANLGEEEWNAVLAAQGELAKLEIHIVDEVAGAEEVASMMDLLATQYGCGVVAIDHIQKLYLRGRWENRQQEMTRISNLLSTTGKRLKLCTILASQLARPEQKHGEPPPPNMSNLRESGALEQDADSILFLHRPDYYHKGKSKYEKQFKTKVVVDKQRDGRTGFFTLRDELEFQRFRELTQVERMTENATGDVDPMEYL